MAVRWIRGWLLLRFGAGSCAEVGLEVCLAEAIDVSVEDAGLVAVAHSARVALVRWGRARGCERRGPQGFPSLAQARAPTLRAWVPRRPSRSLDCGTRRSGTCPRGRMPRSRLLLLSSRACCSECLQSGACSVDIPPSPSTGRGEGNVVSRAGSDLQTSTSG
jgi:hypothetical protein